MYYRLPPWPTLYLYTVLLALGVAVCLMPLAIRLSRRLNVVDHPAPNKIHPSPVPRTGGIVIFIAFAFAVLFPNYRDNPMKGVMVGAFICLVVGAIDDFRGGIPAVVKFGALLCATLVMSYFGVRLNLFRVYPLDLAITMLWIVGMTSAFNGLDNMDGAASGVTVIVSSMFLVIALQSFYEAGTETSLAWFGLLAAGLIGANLGFLVFNFNPARIFMGDSGSFFMGFTLAALGVMGEWHENRVIAATIPVLILGIPIFDFAYIIVRRIMTGETRTLRQVIEHCAPDHLSHRLTWIGFSQRKAVLMIYLMSLVLGVSGVLLHNSDTVWNSALGLLQGVAVVAIIVVLMASAERRHLAAARWEVEKLRQAVRADDPARDKAGKSA